MGYAQIKDEPEDRQVKEDRLKLFYVNTLVISNFSE